MNAPEFTPDIDIFLVTMLSVPTVELYVLNILSLIDFATRVKVTEDKFVLLDTSASPKEVIFVLVTCLAIGT